MKFIRYSKFNGFDVFGVDLGELMESPVLLVLGLVGAGRVAHGVPPPLVEMDAGDDICGIVGEVVLEIA